jgi:hypothetical protein
MLNSDIPKNEISPVKIIEKSLHNLVPPSKSRNLKTQQPKTFGRKKGNGKKIPVSDCLYSSYTHMKKKKKYFSTYDLLDQRVRKYKRKQNLKLKLVQGSMKCISGMRLRRRRLIN